MRKILTLVLAGTAAAAIVGAVASDARACGFFNYHDVHLAPPKRASVPVAQVKTPPPAPLPANERIATADQRLEEEKLADAATQVVTAFPAIRSTGVGASPLETRALRILSLAVVRAGGSLPGVPGFVAAGDAQRGANLEWAIGVLRQVDAARPDDPVAQANLGEALASRSAHEDEAFAILDGLATRDLMGSAHAYATLARLRAGRGDAVASDDATKRCQTMTKVPAAVCKPAPKAATDTRLAVRE